MKENVKEKKVCKLCGGEKTVNLTVPPHGGVQKQVEKITCPDCKGTGFEKERSVAR